MSKDFHFKHEKIEQKPKRVNFLKPKPAVPINSRRNPSVIKEEKTDYDEVFPDRTEEKVSGSDLIDLNADNKEESEKIRIAENKEEREDVKIYNPKKEKAKARMLAEYSRTTKRMIAAAVVLVVLGLICLGIGIYFGIKFL